MRISPLPAAYPIRPSIAPGVVHDYDRCIVCPFHQPGSQFILIATQAHAFGLRAVIASRNWQTSHHEGGWTMTAVSKKQPLGVWLDALERLVISCCAAPPEKEAVCLGRLLSLLDCAPDPILVQGLHLPACPTDWADTDQWTCSSLILSLLEGDCVFMISKGAERLFIASVVLPAGDEETSATGNTLALALIGAIALAVVDRALTSQFGVVGSTSV